MRKFIRKETILNVTSQIFDIITIVTVFLSNFKTLTYVNKPPVF